MRYDATIVTNYLGWELTFPYFRKNWNLDQINSQRTNHPENYVVFRLADVYLMAAEAENELNGPDAAYFYVNRVRERAFEPDQPWSGMSQVEFREMMYDERKFELSAEGHRRMDLIRWGILIETVRATQPRPFNNPGAIFNLIMFCCRYHKTNCRSIQACWTQIPPITDTDNLF